MSAGLLLSEITGEIALFAAVGGLLFALDDLLVDLIYFGRAGWRSLTVYSRYPRAFAADLAAPERPGRLVVLIPAWDEAAVIGDMLRATLGNRKPTKSRSNDKIDGLVSIIMSCGAATKHTDKGLSTDSWVSALVASSSRNRAAA